MVAKGRDASELFPAVVKNVVSKNIEVKKLVFVYLVRYAEEQQDLALLSISTFQRALRVTILLIVLWILFITNPFIIIMIYRTPINLFELVLFEFCQVYGFQ